MMAGFGFIWSAPLLCCFVWVSAEKVEICQLEAVELKCENNQVILIHSARYGRMESRKCQPRGYALGCFADVFDYADRWCSGVKSCFFDEGFFPQLPSGCPANSNQHLQVTYSCIEVALPDQNCYSVPSAEPTYLPIYNDGYIASYTTYETGCGGAGTSWILKGLDNTKGIYIEILDISRSTPCSGESCIYGFIVDENSHKTPIMKGNNRKRLIYSSNSGEVEIIIETPPENRFLLHYADQPLGDGSAVEAAARQADAFFGLESSSKSSQTITNGVLMCILGFVTRCLLS